MDLALTHRRLAGVTVVEVSGELDLLTAGPFNEHLLRLWRPGDELILDLAQTSFVDCSGLRALIRAHERVRQDGRVLRLAALQPLPAKVIRLAGLETVLAVYPSLEHAIGAVFSEGNPAPGPERPAGRMTVPDPPVLERDV